MMNEILGWHFTEGETLGHGDGRKIALGETIKVNGCIIPCNRGLHLSERAIDALQYAPGPFCWRVRGSGVIVPHGNPVNKYACSERTAIAGCDATAALKSFARWCALSVIDKWDAPDVVRKYLETGDENIRAAASDAAADAAADAARVAAADAAWAAARTAAWTAARAAAWTAAWTAARAAARDMQNAKLEEMLSAGMREGRNG